NEIRRGAGIDGDAGAGVVGDEVRLAGQRAADAAGQYACLDDHAASVRHSGRSGRVGADIVADDLVRAAAAGEADAAPDIAGDHVAVRGCGAADDAVAAVVDVDAISAVRGGDGAGGVDADVVALDDVAASANQ